MPIYNRRNRFQKQSGSYVPKQPKYSPTTEEITLADKWLGTNFPFYGNKFMESLRDQWNASKSLSQKQFEALKNNITKFENPKITSRNENGFYAYNFLRHFLNVDCRITKIEKKYNSGFMGRGNDEFFEITVITIPIHLLYYYIHGISINSPSET